MGTYLFHPTVVLPKYGICIYGSAFIWPQQRIWRGFGVSKPHPLEIYFYLINGHYTSYREQCGIRITKHLPW